MSRGLWGSGIAIKRHKFAQQTREFAVSSSIPSRIRVQLLTPSESREQFYILCSLGCDPRKRLHPWAKRGKPRNLNIHDAKLGLGFSADIFELLGSKSLTTGHPVLRTQINNVTNHKTDARGICFAVV